MRKTGFFDKTLTRQLSFSIGAILFLMLMFLGTFLTIKIKKSFKQVTQNYLEKTVALYTASTEKILYTGYLLANQLTTTLKDYENMDAESRRLFINGILRDTLAANPNLIDAWTCWEPNALDGLDAEFANTENHDETGRFIPYWTQSNGKISCTALTDYADGSWYVDPLKSKKGIIIDPNLYNVDGKDMWVCGVAFPIKGPNGKNVGVVGVDMSLDTLSYMLKSARIYDNGYLSLISNSGLTAVDRDIENEGKMNRFFSDPKYSKDMYNAKTSRKGIGFSTSDGYLNLLEPIVVGDTDETWFVGVHVPESEVNADSKTLVIVITIGFIVTTLILTGLSILFFSMLSTSLKRGVSALKNIAHGDGDLTARIEINKDNELGKMYSFFNETMEKLQTSIGQVKTETENMQKIGSTLADDMNDTAAAANQITANIDSVNRQVQQQANNVVSAGESVDLINTNVKKLIENIQNQSSSVVESSAAVEQMVANIRSVTKILENNSSTIKALENSSEVGRTSISSSVEATTKIREQSKTLLDASTVIQNIASQTNLLAMNAAIEAAHAGEAGKGFSVVADEIRKLAEDSNRQGKNITNNLKEVLASIEDVARSSNVLNEKFNEIYELTQKVAQQELTIMNAMQEQSDGGGQVLSAMQQINDVTISVKTGGQEMEIASNEVSKEMSNLMRLTEEITASMEEMALGMGSINKSINEVNDLTHKNTQSISELGVVVSKFKV